MLVVRAVFRDALNDRRVHVNRDELDARRVSDSFGHPCRADASTGADLEDSPAIGNAPGENSKQAPDISLTGLLEGQLPRALDSSGDTVGQHTQTVGRTVLMPALEGTSGGLGRRAFCATPLTMSLTSRSPIL